MNEIFLQNGKKIWLSFNSVRSFSITTNHPDVNVIRDEEDNFLEIKFSNILSFKKGDKILIQDSNRENYVTFILNDISVISSSNYKGIEERINKTCIFILPLLKFNHVYFSYNYALYNGYVSVDHNYLYLKYKFINNEEYIDLEDKLSSHPTFMEMIDDDEYVIFKFKITSEYRSDIKNIIEGRYSSIDEKYKLEILSFHGLRRNSKLGNVLFKDEEYKRSLEHKLGVTIPNNIDLMSKINIEEELWNYQDTSQKVGTTN